MEGAAGEWQREEEGGNWNRPPTNFGLKVALLLPPAITISPRI